MGRPFRIMLLLLGCAVSAQGQELPTDEVQVNLNGYFDNFRVNIVYPSVAVTKKVDERTSITGRYLVDVITSASMKSLLRVDGVTSATSNPEGGHEGGLDEVRNEAGLGITRSIGKGLLGVNGLYSTEHDYASRTLALSASYPFAKNNTVLKVGWVRSWDRVFPQTRSWEAEKNVQTLSLGLTQVLGRRTIAQLDASYATNDGLLSDPYQVVTVIGQNQIQTFEPVHPDSRVRKALGVRVNHKLSNPTSLQLGYRYYWDDWEVRSHTFNTLYQRRLISGTVLGFGVRGYQQSRAFFFEPGYSQPQPFMTVDSKLDRGYTTEFQVRAVWASAQLKEKPILGVLSRWKGAFTARFTFYMRHTDTPNWHSRYRTLYAYLFSFGYRLNI